MQREPDVPDDFGWLRSFIVFTGGRFRHGTKFLRWRPEKDPRQCTMEQVQREDRSALDLL